MSAKSKKNKGVQQGEGALDEAILSIEKSYGLGSIMRMGDGPVVPIDGIGTGSIGLDLAVGGRGFPRGRIIEVYGPESSGKTTLTLHVVANAQRSGGMAAFIDAEHALDPQYAKRLGVNLESLLISQPDSGEQALDICETLIRSGALDVIVIDSVAALVPKAEIEGEMGDHFVGLHARLMSQAMRKLTAAINRTNTCLIFINQIREKIGVMFGSPETTTGGRALKFYSSVRIDIRRIGQIKNGDVPVGARTKATVVKNKVAPPFRKVEFDIIFNQGINFRGELVDMGVDAGVIKRSGTWLSYGDQRLGQGRDRACAFLAENPEMTADIKRQVFEKVAPELLSADGAKPPGKAETAGADEGQGKTPHAPGASKGSPGVSKNGEPAAGTSGSPATRKAGLSRKVPAAGGSRGGAARGAGL